jgi:AraC family transcriptional regulator
MKIRYLIFGILGIVIAFAVSLMIHLGVFKPVEFTESTKGPYQIISKEHVGAYHKIVPVIQEVESWAKKNGFDCMQSFGVYLNNPDAVEEGRLRSFGGCIVDHQPTDLPEGFKYSVIPAQQYLVAKFEGSPAIGPFKVYKNAEKMLPSHAILFQKGVMEIYIVKSEKEMTTYYLFPMN